MYLAQSRSSDRCGCGCYESSLEPHTVTPTPSRFKKYSPALTHSVDSSINNNERKITQTLKILLKLHHINDSAIYLTSAEIIILATTGLPKMFFPEGHAIISNRRYDGFYTK
jgi:hypothetical protein